MTQVVVGTQYGIDFFDADDALISEVVFADQASRDAQMAALGADDNHPAWPGTAVRLVEWRRDVTRPAVRGIDYGPGSVKARFGGGRVPRGAYEFRG